MDKFWIHKLRELKTALDRHLFEKTRFESRRDRTSLQDLRTGQKLKQEEELLCSQFAQMAEFATGIPARNFKFRLAQKSRYTHSTDGTLYFGPSALIDSPPYVAFNVQTLFLSQKPDKHEDEKAKPQAEPKARKTLEEQLSEKYTTASIVSLNLGHFTKLKPTRFDHQADKFTGNISKIDKYINGIVKKFTVAEPAQSEFPHVFIYEGEFVYLTRKGRWASVRTRILSQKDYFRHEDAPRILHSRKLPLIEPDSYMEPESAAEFITDDLAEPIASPSTDAGLGYFVPTRRLGRSTPTLIQPSAKTAIHKPAEFKPAIPMLGSPDFVQDIVNKTQAVERPVGEISPAFVNRTGRKAERARSLAEVLRGRLTLPKSDPVRQAVAALLPSVERIIRHSLTEESTEEDSLAEVERQFSQIVQAQVQTFKVASQAGGVGKVSPILRAGQIERIITTPVTDSLGVFDKFMPEKTGAVTSMGLVAARAERATTTPEESESITDLISSFSQSGRPSLEKEFGEIQKAGVPDVTGKITRGATAVLGKILTSIVKSRASQVFPTMRPQLPGQLAASIQSSSKAQAGAGAADGFSHEILQKVAVGGIAEQSASKFGDLLEPDKIMSGLLQSREIRKKIGKLIKPADLEKLADDIVTAESLAKAKDKLPAGNKQSSERMSAALTAERESAEIGDLLKPGRLGQLASKPEKMLAALASVAKSGKTGLGQLGQLSTSLPGPLQSIMSRMSGVQVGGLQNTPGSIAEALSSAGNMNINTAGLAEQLADGIIGRTQVPGLAAEGISQVSSLLGGAQSPIGALTSGLGQAAPQMSGLLRLPGAAQPPAAPSLPGDLGQSAALLGSGAGPGAAGMLSGGMDQMAAGIMGRASAFMGNVPRMGLNIPAGNIPGLPSGVPELPSLPMADSLGETAPMGMFRMPEMRLPMNIIGSAESETEPADQIPFRAGFTLPSVSNADRRPKGWDRPPFEVGEAIRKHIGARTADQPEPAARREASRLEDYGLSVIDLSEDTAEEYVSPLQQFSEAAEFELDDETMDQIYFRLKRIMETEDERAGGDH